MHRRRTGGWLAGALMGVLLLPAAAAANMANPSAPGDAVGEPGGQLSDLHIEREELVLDLRPLADAASVHVAATYHVRNDGARREVELVFVAEALTGRQTQVLLDGSAVGFTIEHVSSWDPPADIPWRPPATTPRFDGGTVSYGARYEGLIRFVLDISPGLHQVAVRYDAAASAYAADSPARYWQLGYVLAPAREWASFGTLDVSVQLPPGWHFASSPPLQRTGDDARASFQGVPADALAITAQFPVTRAEPISWLLVGIAVAGGVALAALVGIVFGRRGRRARQAWPISLTYAIAAAFVTLFLRGLLMPGAPPVPASQQSWGYFPGLGAAIADGLVLLLSYPLLAAGLFILMQLVVALMLRGSGGNRRSQAPAG